MRILFVCTRNNFRSFAAEACLNDYVKRKGMAGISASSAALQPLLHFVHPVTKKTLSSYGISVKGHRVKPFTKDLILHADLIIAMADYHREKIREKFGADAILFNEIAYGQKTSVDDVDDEKTFWFLYPRWTNTFIRSTVEHIHDGMPRLVQEIEKMEKAKRQAK